MNFSSVDKDIECANRKLTRIKIVRRDRKLRIRGSFPKKNGRGNAQTTISLGVFANPAGVKVALSRAQQAEADLNLKQWDWSKWEVGVDGVRESAAAIGRRFAKQKKQTGIKESTYRANYLYPLESLPNKPLTEELLRSHVLSRSESGSWTRKNDVMVFTALCKFAGVQADLSDLRGVYKPKPVRSSDLPSDEEIVVIWESLRGTGWEWVYGMVATYGLRPHEVFGIVDHKGIGIGKGKVTIKDDSKTGQRDIWPLPDRWRHQFNLKTVVMPNIRFEGRDNQQLGQRVSANLRGKIPHKPYALRHAWAIRSAVLGIPDSIAARWMGHSVAVHAETYHAAINQLQHEAIWDRANQADKSMNGL
ncbi:MAG: hypothetical protein AAGA83_18210 [Cyanobacteria bacterium P01_F01_bin.116]